MSNKKELPTTPDWSKAPEWAQWFAIDKDGCAIMYEKMPTISVEQWGVSADYSGMCCCGYNFDPTNWQNSLQKRPE